MSGICGAEGSGIELFIPLLTFLDEIDNSSELRKLPTNVNTNLSNVEDKISKPMNAKKRGRHL